jgi:hypothetical protein
MLRLNPRLATWRGFRVGHHEGDVAIDLFTGRIDVRLAVTIEMEDDAQQEFYFFSWLDVESVETPDGSPVPFTRETIDGYPLVRIVPDDAPEAPGRRTFVFTQGGVPQCGMDGPISVNLCGWGASTYIAGDLFLPSSLARDFATMDLRITLEAGVTVASTGWTTFVEPGHDGDHEIHHLIQAFPTNAQSFGIGRFEESRIPYGTGGWIRLFTLANANLQDAVAGLLNDMRDVLDFYSSRYGKFLYPKMEAVQVSDKAGAAFGWPALLWIPNGMFGAGNRGYRDDERTALFAHELAHQWYPGMLQNNDSWAAWLSEGFAEYSSVEYMGSVKGSSYALSYYDHYGMLYMYYVPTEADYGLTSLESQYVSSSWIYQIVTYFKGAAVAHILESVMGRDRFLAALRNLYDDYAGKPLFYNTAILQAYLEAEHGESLDAVFRNWVYNKGYPIYTVDVTRVPGEGEGESVAVRVRRGSSWKWNQFEMPITFAVQGDEGEVEHRVLVDQDDMTFTWDVPGRLVRMRFDPARDFFKRIVPGLPGDWDLSGEVDGIDLLYTAWAQGGRIGYTSNFLPWVDFDGDGSVDEKDMQKVLDSFGSVASEVVE